MSEQRDYEESFLARWSRRKLGQQEDDAEAGERALSEGAEPEPPAEEAAQPEPPGDADMPPLESVDAGGSVEPFFSPRVSSGLRRAALRRLFRRPELNVIDGLDDYAADYRHFTPLGDIVTADMRYHLERARAKLAEQLQADDAQQAEAAESKRPDNIDNDKETAAGPSDGGDNNDPERGSHEA
ncbi:DUF3306 domain-containing protein [Algiphilus aromaticivorans]|uniref:DUF3306 domain-containing protein n=1 Tax=Algiphilus aromaticivorans TaxID=382454 RepID=UPI0006940D9C|nr:DUF3306 domain-containing protein [Algiphilus aromaticivorans]